VASTAKYLDIACIPSLATLHQGDNVVQVQLFTFWCYAALGALTTSAAYNIEPELAPLVVRVKGFSFIIIARRGAFVLQILHK
jgi:hypothetical protein